MVLGGAAAKQEAWKGPAATEERPYPHCQGRQGAGSGLCASWHAPTLECCLALSNQFAVCSALAVAIVVLTGQVKIHQSSVNCQLDAPQIPKGEPRPCPIMIFEEVKTPFVAFSAGAARQCMCPGFNKNTIAPGGVGNALCALCHLSRSVTRKSSSPILI